MLSLSLPPSLFYSKCLIIFFMAKHYWCRYLCHLYPILSPSRNLKGNFFRGLMVNAVSNLFLKLQLVFAHARKSATVCNPCLKTATILWFSWYESSAMSTDPVRIHEPHYCDPLDSCFQRMDAWCSYYLRGVVSNKWYGSTEFIDQPYLGTWK